MQSINLSLTLDQIKALLKLGQDQIFRMKFLDPKMPGYKASPGALEAAESAVRVLEDALKEARLRDTSDWETRARRAPMPRVK